MSDPTSNPFATTLADIVTWPVVLFCIGLSIITQVVKKVVERQIDAEKRPKTYWWWREVVLPIIPSILGATLTLTFKEYPLPTILSASKGLRIFFGMGAGMASGTVYQVMKKALVGYLPKEGASIKPPSL
jgi:hypothetical protein